jgi:hypothetical protein
MDRRVKPDDDGEKLPTMTKESVPVVTEEKKLSPEDLAFKAGLHRTYVSGVERGVCNPIVTVLEKPANALDAGLAEMLG